MVAVTLIHETTPVKGRLAKINLEIICKREMFNQ